MIDIFQMASDDDIQLWDGLKERQLTSSEKHKKS